MEPKNPTQNPVPGKRFAVIYQAWSDDERPQLDVTLTGSIAVDHDFAHLVTWWHAPTTPTVEEN